MSIAPSRRPALGPILGATVITDSLDRVLPCYAALGLEPTADAPWGQLRAEHEGLIRGRTVWLAAGPAEPWLRLLEIPGAASPKRFGRPGWFSLEVASNEVWRLAERLGSVPGFELLAGPAPLEISEHIIAMQVAGPSGELYYFTEVQRELPPFDLHQPTRLLDRLFIAVCTARDRAATLAFWTRLNGIDGLSFETRINILNHGLNLAPDHRMPVATLQLAAGSLIEIDQIPTASIKVLTDTDRPIQGIAQISLVGPHPGWLAGPDGEMVEICKA